MPIGNPTYCVLDMFEPRNEQGLFCIRPNRFLYTVKVLFVYAQGTFCIRQFFQTPIVSRENGTF